MADAEEAGAPGEEEQQKHQLSSTTEPEELQPPAPTAGTEKRAEEGVEAPSQSGAISVEPSIDKFKIGRFFVLRVKTRH